MTILLTILVLNSVFILIDQTSATTNNPTKLCVFIAPSSVLSDNSTYACVYVQLQDSSGKPARALEDINVSLSSSLASIGTIDSSVTILKGTTYAIANFTTTFSSGTTTISASAQEYATAIASITTVGPVPYTVGVYGFPSTLPADGNSYEAIMVQLQDSSGSPARAPHGGVQVALSSSNTSVGTVTATVTILEGQTCATANFTTSKAENNTKTQSVIITAISQGYASNQVTITTTPIATSPSQLKIFAGTPKVLADQNSYRQIAVQLQNSSGYPAVRESDTVVTIISNDQSICTMDPLIIVIPKTQTYALANLNTTYKSGTTTITAIATDLPLARQSITTIGFVPAKLAVYCAPTTIPSDNQGYPIIQVQLQDAQGRPGKIDMDLKINLQSSKPTVGTVSSVLTISSGQTQSTGNLNVTNVGGTMTISAQASGFTKGQTTISTTNIDYYTIVASAGGNGAITPEGNLTINYGCNSTFNIAAGTGYHIFDVIVDNISKGIISSYTFTNVADDHKITAVFAPNDYDISISQSPNGQINPGTCSASYGETKIFAINPDFGYHIANITANGALVKVTSPSGQTYQFSDVKANCSLTASFEINKYAVNVIQTVNGNISPSSIDVNNGDTEVFTITPKIGYHINDVLVNGTSVGAIDSYTVQNIQGSTNISAVFVVDPTPTPSPSPSPKPNATVSPIPTPIPTLTPTVINAKTDNGSLFRCEIGGNVTIEQITNFKIVTNQTAATTSVLFTLTGESGNSGLANVTVPKNTVGYQRHALVHIDGKLAQYQGFAQDPKNYYVWFTTPFSTHQISLVFEDIDPSPTVVPQSFLSQQPIFGVVIAIVIIAIIGTVLIVKRRRRNYFYFN